VGTIRLKWQLMESKGGMTSSKIMTVESGQWMTCNIMEKLAQQLFFIFLYIGTEILMVQFFSTGWTLHEQYE